MLFLLQYKLALAAVAAAVGVAAALHRRRLRRQEHSLDEDLATLARAAPGGSPEDPIVVTSTALVETRATALPCHACGEVATKVEEHTAIDFEGERLRMVRVSCAACGATREIYLRVAQPE